MLQIYFIPIEEWKKIFQFFLYVRRKINEWAFYYLSAMLSFKCCFRGHRPSTPVRSMHGRTWSKICTDNCARASPHLWPQIWGQRTRQCTVVVFIPQQDVALVDIFYKCTIVLYFAKIFIFSVKIFVFKTFNY